MVRVPTPEDEDAKRIHRERENLVQEKLRIENRIEALLFLVHWRGGIWRERYMDLLRRAPAVLQPCRA
jgi:hypothetical protein